MVSFRSYLPLFCRPLVFLPRRGLHALGGLSDLISTRGTLRKSVHFGVFSVYWVRMGVDMIVGVVGMRI